MGLGAAPAVLTGPPLPHRPFEIPTAAPPRGLLFLRALQAGASLPCCPRGSQPVSMRGVPTTPRCGGGGSSSPPALLTLCLPPQTEPCGADPWQGRSRSTEVPEQVAAHSGPGAGEIGGLGGLCRVRGWGLTLFPVPRMGPCSTPPSSPVGSRMPRPPSPWASRPVPTRWVLLGGRNGGCWVWGRWGTVIWGQG